MEHKISIGDINILVDKNSNILSLIKEISDKFNDTSPEIRCLYHLGLISSYLQVNTGIVKKKPFLEMDIVSFNEYNYFEKPVDFFKGSDLSKEMEYINKLNISLVHLYSLDKESYFSLVEYSEKLDKQFGESEKKVSFLIVVSIVLAIFLISYLISKIN